MGLKESGFFFHKRWPLFYEDNHLLVLYKPAGLLVQGDYSQNLSLYELAKKWIKEKYDKPGNVFTGIVHRLDKPVAGIVVMAKTSKSARRLGEQFREHLVEKTYFAVVEGLLKQKEGFLRHFLKRSGSRTEVYTGLSKDAQEAVLYYRTIDTFRQRSLLIVLPETGRKHQIRAQLGYIGHPILGDQVYGSLGRTPETAIALFAKVLKITHPTLQKELCIESPLPALWPWPAEGLVDPELLWCWGDLKKLLALGCIDTLNRSARN